MLLFYNERLMKRYLVIAWAIALFVALAPVSQAQEPPQAPTSNPAPAEKYMISEGGVDMRTGQYIFSNPDFGENPGLPLTRDSGPNGMQWWKPMGQFSHNWHIFLTRIPGEPGMANWTVEGARGASFLSENTNSFVARSPTQRVKLEAVSTGPKSEDRFIRYTAADGAQIDFRHESVGDDWAKLLISPGTGGFPRPKSYMASQIREPNGETFDLSYTNAIVSSTPGQVVPAHLTRVESNRGWLIVFEWNSGPEGGAISKACLINRARTAAPSSNICPAGVPTVTYNYGPNGFMTRFTDLANQIHQYASSYSITAWEGNPQYNPQTPYSWTEAFFLPGAAEPYLTLDRRRIVFYDYVSSQQFLNDRKFFYSWYIIEHNEMQLEIAGGSAVRTDDNSQNSSTTSVVYDWLHTNGKRYPDPYTISPGPEIVSDQLGRVMSASYCYEGAAGCAMGPAKFWQLPEGDRIEYTYDGFNNVLKEEQRSKSGNSIRTLQSFTYNCATELLCRKPISMTDGKGNVTNIEYSPVHGGMTRQRLPAVNGIRPETRYYYSSQRAWIKSGGGFVQSSVPIWLLSSQKSCVSSAMNSDGSCQSGIAVTTSFEYQQGSASVGSNLLLKGSVVTSSEGGQAQSLRTCYNYDALGRLISETQPSADLAACP